MQILCSLWECISEWSAFFSVEANTHLDVMCKTSWGQKGIFHSASLLFFQRRLSGGGEPWALGVIFLLLFPSPELTHMPVHLSWGHWSDLQISVIFTSLKNNLCLPVAYRVEVRTQHGIARPLWLVLNLGVRYISHIVWSVEYLPPFSFLTFPSPCSSFWLKVSSWQLSFSSNFLNPSLNCTSALPVWIVFHGYSFQ